MCKTEKINYKYYSDMIKGVGELIKEKGNITVYCDYDIADKLVKYLDFKEKDFDWFDIDIGFGNWYMEYYISKVYNNYFGVENARTDKGILKSSHTDYAVIVDYVGNDYNIYSKINTDKELMIVDYIFDDDDNELFDENDDYFTDSEEAEFELIDECIEFVLNSECEECIADKIIDLAFKFKDIGYTDAKDAMREFVEEL